MQNQQLQQTQVFCISPCAKMCIAGVWRILQCPQVFIDAILGAFVSNITLLLQSALRICRKNVVRKRRRTAFGAVDQPNSYLRTASAIGLAVFCWGALAATDCAAESAPGMALAGHSGVDAAGAFTYTLPIEVPPGTAGMVPGLALEYSSNSGDGILGLGWGLRLTVGDPSSNKVQGENTASYFEHANPGNGAVESTAAVAAAVPASSGGAHGDSYPSSTVLEFPVPLTRCPRTVAQDNIHGGVNYDANDRFCLNGKRLILVGGTYGADGSQYHTEIEEFSEIIAHGQSGNGPLWFEVHTKAGLDMQFGGTSDSRAPVLAVSCSSPVPPACRAGTIRAWAVNRIADAAGNYLTVTYDSGVQDTTNGQVYPTEIDYTGNTNANSASYNAVCFYYNTTQTRPDIIPQYQAGARSQTTVLLTDIKTRLGTGCSQSFTAVTDYKLNYTLASSGASHDELNSITICDQGGNCLAPTRFGWQGSRDQLAVAVPINGQQISTVQSDLVFGDFTGNGLTSYLNVSTQTALCSIPVCFPDPTKVTDGNLVADFIGDGLDHLISLGPAPGYMAADFNGDGRMDYLYSSPIRGGGGAVNMFTNNGNGTFTENRTDLVSPAVATDFVGNGCADVAALDYYAPVYVEASCSPPVPIFGLGVTDWQVLHYYVLFGDFNGDGKIDALVVPKNISGSWVLYLSTGTGSAVGIVIPNSSNWTGYPITGDWNGDGKTDVALVGASSTTFYLSTGTGFTQAASVPTSGGVYPNYQQVADFNNDGADDIYYEGTNPNPNVTEILFSYVPELMTTVNNGNGGMMTVTYNKLNANQPFYTKCPNNPSSYVCGDNYPTQAVDGPTYVASRIDASNGLGACVPPNMTNCYSKTYAYGGAKRDLSGRGFLGFQQWSETDLQTGIVTTRNYRADFPYIGYLTSETQTTTSASIGCQSGVTLKQEANTPGAVNLGGTRNFVFTAQSVTAANDCNGAALPTVTVTNHYDCQDNASSCYGELMTATRSVSDGSSETVTRTYANDTTDWCLDEPITTAVNRVVGSSNITRHSSATYNSCLLSSETVEPGASDPTLTKETDYGYDVYGNVTGVTVKACVWSGGSCTTTSRVTSAAFDGLGEFAISRTDALNHVDTFTYDARFGAPTSHTDPNSVTTAWSFDTLGRENQETRPDGTETIVSYAYCSGVNGGTATCPTNSAFLRQATPTASNGVTQIGPATITYYDALSRAIASDTQGFNGAWVRVSTPYDSLGRIAQTSRPYFVSGGTPAWTVNTYDILGRVTLSVAPNGGHTTTSYNGLSVSVTNADSQTTTTTRNAQGQVASVTNAANKTTSYVYDAEDDLLSVTDPSSNVLAGTYDLDGRKTAVSDPDVGHWTYAYDGFGELASQTNAKSQTTTLAYDALGRVTGRVEPGLTSSWTFDTATHGIGKLAGASTNAGYQRSLTYDALSRPVGTAITVSGTQYNYATAFNGTNGQIASVTYPSGLVVNYGYNATGYLATLTDATSGTVYWTANTRDAELHLLQQTAGNGAITSQVYDGNTGLLLNTCATFDTGSCDGDIVNLSFAWDPIGNLSSRSDTFEGYTENFCYDPLNRLTNYAVGGSSCTTGTSGLVKTVAFDALGNITSKSDTGTYSYGAGAGPHAVTGITGTVNGVVNPTFTYDLNGNLTAGDGRTISYTAFNMASQIVEDASTITLAYDSEHGRIIQTAPSGTTTYLNDPSSSTMSEKLVAGSTTTWHDYIQADGHIVAERFNTAGTITTSYFELDHIGSVAVVTDNTRAVVERDSYDAWGRRRNPNGTDNAPCAITSQTTRGFTNQEEMDAVCLVNLNARIYDPTIARFMAVDPVTATPYDMQSLNRYTYVDNRPLDLTDPTGETWADLLTDPQAPYAAAEALSGIGLAALGGTGDGGAAIATVATGGAASPGTVPLAIAATGAIVAGSAMTVHGVSTLSSIIAKAPQGNKGNTDTPHGSPEHDAAVNQEVQGMRDKGYGDIRKNQTQVDAEGNKVGNNRPDVQGTNPKTGQREHVEVDRDPNRGAQHERDIMRNDPSAKCTLRSCP